MIVVPLSKLLAEVQADGIDHLAGHIASPETFFTAETMEKLNSRHEGVFGFLAFNERGDHSITDYLAEGTLGDDSGSVLCLYATGAEPETGAFADMVGIVDVDDSASYGSQILKRLFSPAPMPPLPGIAFFAVLEDDKPVYVPLGDNNDAASVRKTLRRVVSYAEAIDKAQRMNGRERSGFCPAFAMELQRQRVPHVSAGQTCIREWLMRASQIAWEHKGDILTVVGLVL